MATVPVHFGDFAHSEWGATPEAVCARIDAYGMLVSRMEELHLLEQDAARKRETFLQQPQAPAAPPAGAAHPAVETTGPKEPLPLPSSEDLYRLAHYLVGLADALKAKANERIAAAEGGGAPPPALSRRDSSSSATTVRSASSQDTAVVTPAAAPASPPPPYIAIPTVWGDCYQHTSLFQIPTLSLVSRGSDISPWSRGIDGDDDGPSPRFRAFATSLI